MFAFLITGTLKSALIAVIAYKQVHPKEPIIQNSRDTTSRFNVNPINARKC